MEFAEPQPTEPQTQGAGLGRTCSGQIASNLPQVSADVRTCGGFRTPPQCSIRDFLNDGKIPEWYDTSREGSNSPKYPGAVEEVGYCRNDGKCCHGYKCVKQTLVNAAVVLGSQAIGFVGSCLPASRVPIR